MKTILILLSCLMTGCSSNSGVERTTTTANGVTTVTERPAMDPEDAAFHAQCQRVLERRFE